MKYLITGGLGHIGSKLLRDLCSYPDVQIVVYDDLRTQRFASVFYLPEKQKVKLKVTNVVNILEEDIEKEKFDLIIHLAATTDAAGTANQPEKIYQNNLLITEKIVGLAAKFNIPLIFTSSTSVYGSQDNEVDEDSQNLSPKSPYAICKIQEEQIIASAGLSKFSILRFGTIFGFSEGMRFHTAVNKFCWQAANGEPISVWETAMYQVRPYLGLQDAVRAIIFFANKLVSGEEVNSIFNVVTLNASVNEILEIIHAKLGEELAIDFVKSPIMNQYSFSVSSSKLEKLGFITSDNLEFEISKVMDALSGLKR